MNYWLFKTEPHVYGIDDLAKAPGRAHVWDGIRNYQARNFLRDQVAAGDQVFIYHSSCKNVGIAGIAEVSQAAYPDPQQFEPDQPGYDPKASAEQPRWFNVDLRFRQQFSPIVSLAALKQVPALETMVLLKQGRLSVQPVTADQWQVICHLAGVEG